VVQRTVEEIHQIENELWREFKKEDWLDNLANKMSEFQWLRPKFSVYDRKFREAQSVLELGGGEGWASCLAKRLYPGISIAASDISEYAISGIDKWEKLFESKVDNWFSCKSYEVPLPDSSVDLIFTFQAAHHFVLQMKTIQEVKRLLRPGGTCMYLNEPSCRRYLHPIAKWRVNKKRPDCPEDVLVFEEMREAAAAHGFRLEVNYTTSTFHRGVVEGVYYKALSMAPVFCRWLPCTADFIFTKA
jgi:ubiquinone/menaquinone biosynthesis C-methylase UbiE